MNLIDSDKVVLELSDRYVRQLKLYVDVFYMLIISDVWGPESINYLGPYVEH